MTTRQDRYNPGELAPRSGTYRAVGGDSREAHMDEGERLPPIPGGGEWEFVSSGQGRGGSRSQSQSSGQSQSSSRGNRQNGGQEGGKNSFNPGELAPHSGTYRANGGDNREAHMSEGDRLPPIPGGGEWEFVGSGRGGQRQGGRGG